MAGEIATAYVRIRPQMASFRSETESGIKGAFSNIGKIVGGAFAAVGAFEFGKHIVEEASGQQAAFAVLDRTIRNVGASTRGFGDDLESVLAKEARLKGFSDQQLAGGLTQLVSVTHNTRKAFQDLTLAEDLARARHKDLTVASLALARAEQGSTTTLSRFGIKVPEVTVAVDRLKKAHDQAVASGAKFTGQTKIEYGQLLAQAQATDKAATKTEALRLVQERFGGVATTFAKSSAGEFARFHENINQLEIGIGRGLLPGLSGAAAGLNKYVGELSTSNGLQNVVRGGAHNLGQAFGAFKSIVEAIGPPLLAVAHGAEEVTHSIGVAPILAAVAAYKGIAFGIAKAAAAEQAYARTVAAGRAPKTQETEQAGAQVGLFTRLNASLTGVAAARERDSIASTGHAGALERETAATTANLAATNGSLAGLDRLTVALEANTVAATADVTATEELVAVYGPLGGILARVGIEANGAAAGLGRLGASEVGVGVATIGADAGAAAAGLEGLAASEAAVGVAGGAAAAGGLGTFATGIGRLGLGAVGGPVGAAVLGIAALAGGIAYLATRESSAEKATKNLEKTFLAFGQSQDQVKQSAIDLAQAHASLGSDRVAAAQARTNVETARAALATTGAAKGTAEYSRLTVGLQGALAAYRSQLVQLRADELRLSQAQQARAKAVSDQAGKDRSAIAATSSLAKAATGDARVAFLSQAVEIRDLKLEISRLSGAREQAIRLGKKFAEQEALNNLRARVATLQNKQAAAAVDDFAAKLEKAIPKLQAQSPLVAHNTSLLLAYTQQVGHVPSEKVTNLILRTPNLNATLADVDAKLKSLDPQAFADGQAIGIAWGQGILAGIHGISKNPLGNAIKGLEGPLVGVSKGIQAKVRAALATGLFSPGQIAKQFGITPGQVSAIEKQAEDASSKAVAAAKRAHDRQLTKPKNLQNIIPFKVQLELAGAVTPAQQRKALEDEIAALNQELTQNLTESSRRAIELERASAQAQLAGLASTVAAGGDTVAKTIATAHQAIEKSISEARTNLDSIGAKLGASIDKFLGKGGVGSLDSAQTAAFKKLKDLIKSGGSRLDIERAGQELQANLAAKSAGSPTSAKDQVRALTDQFNKGKISLKTFDRDVVELLKKDKISYTAAGKLLGRSFEDGLRSQVTGLEKQAGAIAAVPEKFRRGAGGGDALKIIRPLEVIQRENALIRQSQDRHAVQAAHQRERIIRASERTARAAEKTAASVAGANFVKNHMIHGKTSAKAKAAAKAGIRP